MHAARPIRQHIADPVRILLIEGEPGCAERAGNALARIEWAYARIDTAASLRQALARLKLEKFDLVLADLELPDCRGLDALRELVRAFDGLIVVLAADEDPALREQVLGRGAFELLPKPRIDAAALERFLRLATAEAAGSVRSLRSSEARFRKTFELARCQEALARFGQAALALREPKELIAEAVRTVTHAVAAREVSYIEAGDLAGVNAALVDVLHCGVHFVCNGTAIVPVHRDGEVRGALSAQGEDIDADTLPFLDTLASLLSTALQRIDSERRLTFLAQFDPLTGLANRNLLTERLSQMIGQAERRGTRVAVLFVDLDHFKLVNETLEHAGGDELLREAALRVQGAVRIEDMVARLNGDEFAVVLPEVQKAEDAALVAQTILERLSQRFLVRGRETFLTASVGIAAHPGDGEGAEALIGAAEAAMHRAKQSGRNGYQFFTSEITRGTRVRAHLALELRRALERDQFRLAYQPKIDLRSSRPPGIKPS